MSDNAVLYSYVNVGFNPVPKNDGTVYSYVNVGWTAASSAIGRVLGLAAPTLIATFTMFVNLGMQVVSSPAGVAYSDTNVLDYQSGESRVLEDGTARVLEDGTTQRITE